MLGPGRARYVGDPHASADAEGSEVSTLPRDVRRRNLSLIMRRLLESGPVARAELASTTGMASGTVTKLVAALIEAGVVTELTTEPRDGVRGRPRIPVAVDRSTLRVVGVHIGHPRTNLSLLDLRGRALDGSRLLHASTDVPTVLAQAVEGINDLVSRADGRVVGLGASTAGWVDAGAGSVVRQPVLGWSDVPLRGHLAEATGLPVHIESTVRALALAERWFGAAAGTRDSILLFVGNVVGAGLVVNGHVQRGSTAAAGVLDHLRVGGHGIEPCRLGHRDCLAAVATDAAVVEQARSAGVLTTSEGIDTLLELAVTSGGSALEILHQRARHAGVAAGVLLDLLDPELVVLAGGALIATPDHLEHVRAGAAGRRTSTPSRDRERRVVGTAFGTQAAPFSAGAVVLDQLYRDPSAFLTGLRPVSGAGAPL